MASIDALRKELEVYEKVRDELLEKCWGKVVAIRNGKLWESMIVRRHSINSIKLERNIIVIQGGNIVMERCM